MLYIIGAILFSSFWILFLFYNLVKVFRSWGTKQMMVPVMYSLILIFPFGVLVEGYITKEDTTKQQALNAKTFTPKTELASNAIVKHSSVNERESTKDEFKVVDINKDIKGALCQMDKWLQQGYSLWDSPPETDIDRATWIDIARPFRTATKKQMIAAKEMPKRNPDLIRATSKLFACFYPLESGRTSCYDADELFTEYVFNTFKKDPLLECKEPDTIIWH